MTNPEPLSFHDHFIRAIGYAFLVIPCLGLPFIALVLLSERESLRVSDWAMAGFIAALSLPFLAIGRWIVGKYRTGQGSGF